MSIRTMNTTTHSRMTPCGRANLQNQHLEAGTWSTLMVPSWHLLSTFWVHDRLSPVRVRSSVESGSTPACGSTVGTHLTHLVRGDPQ